MNEESGERILKTESFCQPLFPSIAGYTDRASVQRLIQTYSRIFLGKKRTLI